MDDSDPMTVLLGNAAEPSASPRAGPTPLPDGINPHTDLANAKRFAREHAAEVKYSKPEKCWYTFTGQRWQRGRRDSRART